ncbi:MAG: RecB-family nuclease [Candidatus Heimdallarchaeota archaeon]|nr:RecB-family nuclease [Candidatus Heimdallarchaeota archaeon]MDH5645138.1 RecB-family nuclease [Candidatus Heimdallarchaeota archaeon]
MSNVKYPIVVFHNVTGASRCSEFVKIASGMGYKTLIITNAQGSAAQKGLPTAQRLALQNGLNFMTLGNITDVKELFQPDMILLVVPPPYGSENLTSETLKELEGKRWIVVFGGNDPGLSKKDLELGDKVLQVPAGDLGSIGMLTLGLALLTGKFRFGKE